MDMTVNHNRPIVILLVLMILTSSVVLIEPAPYDLLLVMLVMAVILNHYAVFTVTHFWPTLFLFVFLETNLVSFFFIQDVGLARHYFPITVYCMVGWLGLVGLASGVGERLLAPVFKAYVIAALIAAIPGIIAFISQGSVFSVFLWHSERVQGLFKDPNVFGPFLVPAILYALWRMGNRHNRWLVVVGWLGAILVLSVGVLLSFSRASWGQYILAIGGYLLFINDRSTRRLKTLFILTCIFLPVVLYIVLMTNVGDLFFTRMHLQGYDTTRFDQQEQSLDYMFQYPLGFGPGQSEHFLSQSTHNLFVRVLSENGLLGLLSFGLFLVLTIGRGFYMARKVPLAYKGYFIIVTMSLIGILFNSLFIDSMHWRHFWLLLALPWMDVAHWEVERWKSSGHQKRL